MGREIRDGQYARASSTYLASLPMKLVICTLESERRGEEITYGRAKPECSKC